MEQFFDKYLKTVLDTETILYTGTVTAIRGLMIRSRGPYAKIGELCTIKNTDGTELVAEVVGFDQEENAVNLMAYGDTKGIMAGSEVVASGKELRVPVGKKLLGRIIDALGRPYDKKGPLQNDEYYPAVRRFRQAPVAAVQRHSLEAVYQDFQEGRWHLRVDGAARLSPD